jgi:hypothetical protein
MSVVPGAQCTINDREDTIALLNSVVEAAFNRSSSTMVQKGSAGKFGSLKTK